MLFKMTAVNRIINNGMTADELLLFCDNSIYPHVAGNSFPIFSRILGRNSAGNIIPDSMIEGKNIIWLYIVNFA